MRVGVPLLSTDVDMDPDWSRTNTMCLGLLEAPATYQGLKGGDNWIHPNFHPLP